MTKPTWISELIDLLGSEQVILASDEIYRHSYDWWPVAFKWQQQGKQPYCPDVVVRPQDVEEVSRLLRWANENGVPVTPWGAGSAVTGAALPTRGGISLDMTTMNGLLALEEVNLVVTVQAGMMGHHLETELNAGGYTLNHSPQSLDRSTIGGWIATRATGQFSSRWGGIEDFVVSFTVVLPNGEIIKIGHAPRAALGPDLRHLFMGAEGTLGVVTDATLKIFPLAEHRRFEALRFESIEPGLVAMRQTIQAGLRPFLVRFYDEAESRHAMQDQKFSGCVMFLGFEGLQDVTDAECTAGMKICQGEGGEPLGPEPALAWMERRFDFSTVENCLAEPGGVAETIEVAHVWDSIFDTYQALSDGLVPLADEVLGHFSHVYPQGTSLYVILLGKADNAAAAEKRLLEIWKTAMQIALEHGAVISHHHGVGLARLPYIQEDLGRGFTVLEQVKAALDPMNIMNPGKLGL